MEYGLSGERVRTVSYVRPEFTSQRATDVVCVCVCVVNEAGRRAEMGLSVFSVVRSLGQRWSGEIPAVKRPKPEPDRAHYM